MVCGATLVSMSFRASGGEAYRAQALYMDARADELDALRSDASARAAEPEQEPNARDAGHRAPRAASQKSDQDAERPLELAELGVAILRLAAVGAPAVDAERRADLRAGARLVGGAVAAACELAAACEPAAARPDGAPEPLSKTLCEALEGARLAARAQAAALVDEVLAATGGTA